jgi:hypothetical protein
MEVQCYGAENHLKVVWHYGDPPFKSVPRKDPSQDLPQAHGVVKRHYSHAQRCSAEHPWREKPVPGVPKLG